MARVKTYSQALAEVPQEKQEQVKQMVAGLDKVKAASIDISPFIKPLLLAAFQVIRSLADNVLKDLPKELTAVLFAILDAIEKALK
jgi:hypothetical protein